MTFNSQRLARPQDRRFLHNANSAGAPLPLIPRRASSTPKSPSLPPSFSFPRFTSSRSFSPSSPRDDSDSSSSSGIRPTVCTKKMRGVRSPEAFAPALRELPKERRLVRKKSGQLVKSSLKSSKSAPKNLSIVTFPQSSKSEPTTPMQKAVHFDAQLEHVKLFLAEQKPLAVSRDGSPTDDTSGTDSDFPKFIYGEGDDRRSRKKLLMQLSNMPGTINPNSDVALENLSLTPDGMSILGRVRVRNLAFSKWLAIRFTFDSWQTTSEVTGRYVESLNSEFDRFSFTIRLNDILARIEGKTFIMAIRYSVAGRDIWDNNDGQNYLATFTKCKADATGSPALSDEEAYTDMADLRSKLEEVSQSDDRTGPAFLSQQPRPQSASVDDMTCFRTSASFASRYDFAASLKSPWDPSKSSPSHARNQSFPLTGPRTSPSLIHWPQRCSIDVLPPKRSPVPTKFNMGSPRDIGDDMFTHYQLEHIAVDSELSTPSLFTPSSSESSTSSPTELFMSDEDAQSLSPDTHYRQFINKFCFFTGQGTFLDESTVDLLPRTQSVSDIEELLSGISPRLPCTTTLSTDDVGPPTLSTSSSVSPTRSSSLDDLVLNRSGSLTPTVSRLALMSTSGSITISASVSRNNLRTPILA